MLFSADLMKAVILMVFIIRIHQREVSSFITFVKLERLKVWEKLQNTAC